MKERKIYCTVQLFSSTRNIFFFVRQANIVEVRLIVSIKVDGFRDTSVCSSTKSTFVSSYFFISTRDITSQTDNTTVTLSDSLVQTYRFQLVCLIQHNTASKFLEKETQRDTDKVY